MYVVRVGTYVNVIRRIRRNRRRTEDVWKTVV